MTRRRREIPRLASVLMAAVLALGMAGMTVEPAYAQGAAGMLAKTAEAGKDNAQPKDLSGASTQELEALAKTLQDDAQRKKFLDTLNALIAARKAEDQKARKRSAGNGLATRIANAMTESVEALGRRVSAVVAVLGNARRLVPWLESWIYEGDKRDRLLGLIWRFLVVVGLGMLAQYLFRKVTAQWRSVLEQDEGTAIGGRIVRFLVRTILLFANAFAYGAGAYGGLLLLPMGGVAGEVLLVGASSFFVAKLILATTRTLVAPGAPLLRPVPVSDETANYLYIWVRRLVRIFVYAFFFLMAAQLVGLPEPAYRSLLYLVGLAFVAFLIVFVLQNRAAVADAIRGTGRPGRAYGGVRARLASIWHLFAIIYIVAVYAVWMFEVKGGFEFLMVATFWTVVAIAVAKGLVVAAGRGISRLFAVGAELDARYPGLEARANRYVPVLNGIVRWVVFVFAAIVVLDIWGANTLDWLGSAQGAAFMRKAVTVAFILIAGVIIWEVIALAIGRYLDRMEDAEHGAARARTLLPLMRTTALIFVSVVVVLAILSEIGFNIGPLLAGAGVIGLAIGFGSQKLVQDVITGLFILVENTLAVGDVVRFDSSHAGVVEALSIRSVRLRDLSGNVHTLPFSEVKTILNMTKEWSYYVFEVGIAYREDVDHVMGVLREIGAELEADPELGPLIVEPLEVLGLDKFADSAIIIKARIKVQPPLKQWTVGREFNRRMKARFDAEGIEIPFPHQTIYFGVDQEGNAPPAHVAVVEEEARAAAAETSTPKPTSDAPRRQPSVGNIGDGNNDL